MDMIRRRTKLLLSAAILLILSALFVFSAAAFRLRQREYLVIRNQESGDTYVRVPVETGDELTLSLIHI